MTEEHRQRMKAIEKFNKNPKYPYLNKVLKYQSLGKLKQFLNMADNRKINEEKLSHEGKYPYFTLPIKQLKNKYKGGTGTWSRNINLFVTLGLIGKVNSYEINSNNYLMLIHSHFGKMKTSRIYGIDINHMREQSIYYLFPYTNEVLEYAEQQAKIMFESGFTMKSFSKIYLQRVFGKKFANSVYFNKIKESKYTLALMQQIEDVILKLICEKHFTYKQEIIKLINVDNRVYKHYEKAYKNYKNKTAVAEFEYARSINFICKRNNIEQAKTTNEMKIIFGMDTNRNILYDKDYYNNNIENATNIVKFMKMLKRSEKK